MNRKYLGDSYDAVKRLWQQVFAGWSPLYFERRFLQNELHDDFTRLTHIPILTNAHPPNYSILNDPDTGIRLPGAGNQDEGRKHITVSTIIEQLRAQGPQCVITFDQSHYRHNELSREQQRRAKMDSLFSAGLFPFYYVSHAPFLFAFSDIKVQRKLQVTLAEFGIPADRLETYPK